MSPPIDDNTAETQPKRKRRLRAAFAADIANFSGRVSVNETRAFGNLSTVLKIGQEELDRHDGKLIGMPGDGLFALFESAVDAVQCALAIQERLGQETNLGGMKLRIGIHVGDVLFEGDLPFGETLNIAARLESLADPGGILISGTVVDSVSARIQATFEERGVPRLKNIPRRITTYAVHAAERLSDTDLGAPKRPALDSTMHLVGKKLDAPKAPVQPEPEPPKSAPRVSLQEAISVARFGTPTEEDTEATQADPIPTQEVQTPPQSPPASPPAPQTEKAPPVSPPPPKTEPPPPVAAPPPEPKPTPKPKTPAPPVAKPAPAQIAESEIAQVAEALAVYAGPVAKVMVNRMAKTASSVTELIEFLEEQLPNPTEKAAFRSRLQKFFGR